MRRLLVLACLIVFFPALLLSQGGNIGPVWVVAPSAPSSCSGVQLFFNSSNGQVSSCQAGTFVTFSAGTGAAITGTPVANQIAIFSAANSITNGNLSGDCTTSGALATTCTKTSGVAFATSATTDATNASNISSGNLALARLPAGLNSPVSGGILSATGASTFAWSGALVVNQPIIGGGVGAVPTSGTRSGTTTQFATVNGAVTPGHTYMSDANGNLVDSNNLPGTVSTGTRVNAANASPGIAYSANTASLTFTQGSATIGVSDTSYNNSSFIGSKLCYTTPSPNFCTIILGVSGSSITVSSPYPGTTVSGVGSANYTNTIDQCARINAAILNNPGAEVDATTITGTNLSCTIQPFANVTYNAGGALYLGAASFKVATTWIVPYGFKLIGIGRGNATAGNALNSVLSVDTVNFPLQGSVQALASTGVTTTAGTATFNDTGATGLSAYQVGLVAASAACDSGNFAHFQVASAINGLIAGQGINLAGFGGATWNGTNAMIAGVSGTFVEIMFSTTCAAPGTLGTVGVLRSDILQGSYAGAATGTLTSSISGSVVTVTDTASDFLATDEGSCFVTPVSSGTVNTSGTTVTWVSGTQFPTVSTTWNGLSITINGVVYTVSTITSVTTLTLNTSAGTQNGVAYSLTGPNNTILEYTSGTAVNIARTTDPGWSGSSTPAFTKTCYLQSAINTTVSSTSLTTTLPMQSTFPCTSCGTTVTYSIMPPVITWANFSVTGSTNSANSATMERFQVNCSTMVDCTGVQDANAQEESYANLINVSNYSSYAFDIEQNGGNSGPWLWLTSGSSPNTYTPLTSCMEIAASFHGVNGMSCGSGGAGSRPYTAVDVNAAGMALQNIHVENYGNGFDLCRYITAAVNGGTSGGCMGVSLISNTPGVTMYNDYHFKPGNGATSAATAVQIIGSFESNAPAHAVVDDWINGPHCGTGHTILTSTLTHTGLGRYTVGPLNNAALYRVRDTDAYGIDNCAGTGNTVNGASTFNANYFKANTQVAQVTGSNFTTAANVPTTITGLTWTEPQLSAQNWSYECKGSYSEAATLGTVSFFVTTATTATTNLSVNGWQQVAAGTAGVPGTPLQGISSTTAQTATSGTPGVAGVLYLFDIWGTFEGTSTATPTVFQLQTDVSAAAGTLTVYRGANCTIW